MTRGQVQRVGDVGINITAKYRARRSRGNVCTSPAMGECVEAITKWRTDEKGRKGPNYTEVSRGFQREYVTERRHGTAGSS